MKIMKIGILFITLAAILFITACDINPDDDTSFEYIISEDTVILEQDTVTNEIDEIDPVNGDPSNGYIFTVSSTSDLAGNLQPGDILACDVSEKLPYGMLQKIVLVDKRRNSIVYHTEPAAIDEAFEELHIDHTFELDPEKISQSTPLVDGVTFSPGNVSDISKSGINFNYNFNTTLAQYGAGRVTATGGISVGISSRVIIDINLFAPSRIGYEINFDESVRLEVAATYNASVDVDIPVYSHTFTPITIWIGPVPVVFIPKLTISVGIDGTITANASAGIQQTAHIGSSLIWSTDTGRWTFTQNRNAGITPIYPSAEVSCSAKATAGPILDVLIYGIIGPYVRSGGYLELNVNLSTDPPPLPWLTLDAGLEAAIGINLGPIANALNWVGISVNGREEYVIPIIEQRILELSDTDLAAVNLSATPPGPYPVGQSITFRAQAENPSLTNVSDEIRVRWELYQLTPDYMLMDTIDQTISSLAANTASGYFEQEWMPIPGTAGIGTCRVVFIVDPENSILEINEDNNEVSMDFEIDTFS